MARTLEISQDIQRSHEPLRVGDSVTRRVTVKAEGAQAMLLPAPAFAEVKDLKRYLEPPSVKPLGDGRGGVDGGIREDAVTYVIGEAGHLELPAIEYKWWDASTGEAHRVSVPAVELEAAKGSYQAPFSIDEDLRALGQHARVRLAGHGLLLATLLVAGAYLAYFVRPWAGAALAAWRRWRVRRREARLASAGYAWRLAREQLAESPAQLGGFYLWVRRSTGRRTLSDFSRNLPFATENPLLAFLKLRYGTGRPNEQAPADLLRQLPDVRQALVQNNKQATRTEQGLKPLNP
ncbi:Oxygen tolerance [compost metagenome]